MWVADAGRGGVADGFAWAAGVVGRRLSQVPRAVAGGELAGAAGVAADDIAGAAGVAAAGGAGVAGVAGGGCGALGSGVRVRPALGSTPTASAPLGRGGAAAAAAAAASGRRRLGTLARQAPSARRGALLDPRGAHGREAAGSDASALRGSSTRVAARAGAASTSSPAASRAAFSRISAIQASASSIPCVFAFSISGSGSSSGAGSSTTGAAGGGAATKTGGATTTGSNGRVTGASRVASASSFGARAPATASPSHARGAARAVRCSTKRSVIRTGRGGSGGDDESLGFRSSTSQLWSGGGGEASAVGLVQEAAPVAVLEVEDHVERPVDVIGETGRLREQLLRGRPHHSPNRPSSTSVMSTSNSCAQDGQLTTPTASPSLLMRS